MSFVQFILTTQNHTAVLPVNTGGVTGVAASESSHQPCIQNIRHNIITLSPETKSHLQTKLDNSQVENGLWKKMKIRGTKLQNLEDKEINNSEKKLFNKYTISI